MKIIKIRRAAVKWRACGDQNHIIYFTSPYIGFFYFFLFDFLTFFGGRDFFQCSPLKPIQFKQLNATANSEALGVAYLMCSIPRDIDKN